MVRKTELFGLLIVTILGLITGMGQAHEVPADARLYSFFKPEGRTLEILLRVPMQSLTDVDYPLRNDVILEVSRADQSLRNATKLWLTDNIEVYENGAALPKPRVTHVRVSLPADKSFAAYDSARALVDAPRIPDADDIVLAQMMMDVRLEYDIASDKSDFAIHARFERLAHKVSTSLRFMPPGGPIRAFELAGDAGHVLLDPRWHQAALRFTIDGFRHILDGIDHLLFLACLVIPFRRLRPLAAIVTAFTLAHSITLIAAASGYVPDGLWFPPLIETLIAATIVYMAIENIVGSDVGRRWVLTFTFGLIHGFGFSFALKESLQFAGDHLLTSLLAFNVGVEIGQLAVLIVLVPVLALLFRYAFAERMGVIILSALVLHTAWHWLLERGETLLQYPFPVIDLAFIAGAMRAMMAALILAGLIWLVHGTMKRWLQAGGAPAKDLAE